MHEHLSAKEKIEQHASGQESGPRKQPEKNKKEKEKQEKRKSVRLLCIIAI